MRINTNVNAMIATNQMSKNTALSGASMEKLSTGLRITKAGDDATGLAISEKMRAQIRGMEQADRNVQDGISMVQTAEGAMEETGNILQRMRELSVQGANETNTASDRAKMQEELNQLYDEIDRIAQSSEFNGKNLLNEGKRAQAGDVKAAVDSTIAGGNVSDKIDNLSIEGFKGMDIKSASLGISKDGTRFELKVTDNDGHSILATAEIKDADAVTAGIQQNDVKFDFGGGNTITLTVQEDNVDQIKGAAQDIDITSGSEEIKLGDLLDTEGLKVNLQIGANTGTGQSLDVEIANTSTAGLKLSKTDLNISDDSITAGTANANNLINKLDKALETVNTNRSKLGAMQNRLETAQSNLTTSTENLTAAESRIRDVDVAKEMVKLSKLNILNQASQAMVSQAKQQPESVSQLLR